MSSRSHSSLPPVPAAFTAKKAKILADLAVPDAEYTDKSPKGTVDVQIRDLIDEVNAYDGFVTTSSCAGRVAVYVEGPKPERSTTTPAEEDGQSDGRPVIGHSDDDDGAGVGAGRGTGAGAGEGNGTASERIKGHSSGGPGGKGGGHWLFVSHDPIALNSSPAQGPTSQHFTELFGLSPSPGSVVAEALLDPAMTAQSSPPPPRLIRLSFSPLILHVFCASLHHARPLLAAAIESGFRESGVQSLKGLDDEKHGAMVAVRTAGLGFETVVGVGSVGLPRDGSRTEDAMHCIVSEQYLALCAAVVNERFKSNVDRRERFRDELRRAMAPEGRGLESRQGSHAPRHGWEEKQERRERKRAEGLRRQREQGTAPERGLRREQTDHDAGDLVDGLVAMLETS